MTNAHHQQRVYPFGHPVDFESDASEVIQAVLESWGAFPQLFDSPALRFRIDHSPHGPAAHQPRFRIGQGILEFCCDPINQGSFSLQTRSGWMRVNRATLAKREWFRYHLLEALVLTALDTVFFTPVHAACVARGERGVLLCGDSGTGKTTLAFAAARAGWSLVSEDGVHFAPDQAITAVGGAHTLRLREPARELFPELRSRPASTTNNGKTAIAVTAAALGIHTEWSTTVSHSVFLARQPGPAQLLQLPADQGLPFFLEWARNPACSGVESRLRQVLARGCWRLEYQEFPEAVRLLDLLP